MRIKLKPKTQIAVGSSIMTKFNLEEWTVSGFLDWPELSSLIFNALFNQIQEVHLIRKLEDALNCYGHDFYGES